MSFNDGGPGFLLTAKAGLLKAAVGIGVGLAAVLGTLRFVYGWSLEPIIYVSTLLTLPLTAFALTRPDMKQLIGVAWDCGAVTTGPVTVPLVLALGIGGVHPASYVLVAITSFAGAAGTLLWWRLADHS